MSEDLKKPAESPNKPHPRSDRTRLESLGKLWEAHGPDAACCALDALSDCGFICGPDGKVTHANAAFDAAVNSKCRPVPLDWLDSVSSDFDLDASHIEGDVTLPTPSNPPLSGRMSMIRVGENAIGLIVLLSSDQAKSQPCPISMREAIDAASEAFAFVDEHGRIQAANPSFLHLHGLDQRALSNNLLWTALLTPASIRTLKTEIVPALELDGAWAGTLSTLDRDGQASRKTLRARKLGERVELIFAMRPEQADDPSQAGFASSHQENERLTRLLNDANARAAQSDHEARMAQLAKTSFLASMSHEIRTPMNAIIGMTNILMDTKLTPEQLDYLATIQSSGDSLLGLISDILDYSKIESDRTELESNPMDVRHCIEESLDSVALDAQSKGLELCYNADSELPYGILGDAARFRQIICILLANAIKFTEKGQIEILARLQSRNDEECVLEFEVRDSGIGIPIEMQDRLFQSFSQIDSSSTRKYGGTGLGLAIARKLSELMGGKMWVVSEDGWGSSFLFTLRGRLSETSIYTPELNSQAQSMLGEKKILIVEDNRVSSSSLRKMLEQWNAIPQVEESLSAAKKTAQQSFFDLVLADVDLLGPDIKANGSELLSLCSENTPELICLTPFRKPLQVEEWKHSIAKPIKRSSLFDALRKAIQSPSGSETPRTVSPPREEALGDRCPMKILMAEDNVVNQRVAKLILKKLNYKVDVVENGQLAVDAAMRADYDVIIMDIQMPVMDGHEATEEITRRLPSEDRPYIIALTANSSASDRERAKEVGMDDFLAKPIKTNVMAEALEQAYLVKRSAVGGYESFQ